MTIQQFGASIKAKYPEYKDVDDATLGQKMLEKYPEYKDRIDTSPQNKLLESKAIPVGGSIIGGLIGSILGPVGAAGGAGAGYMGGDVIRKEIGQLTGVQNQPQDVKQNVGETMGQSALASLIGLGAGATGQAIKTVIPAVAATKSLSPIKIASWLRDQAATKAGNVTTEKLIEAGDKFVIRNPLAQKVWDTFKPTITEKMSAKELLGRMSQVFGQAYSRGGTVKDTAQAELLNQLYQAGKSTLAQQAPEVAKYTTGMRQILTAPKTIQNLTWLLAKLGLAKGAF